MDFLVYSALYINVVYVLLIANINPLLWAKNNKVLPQYRRALNYLEWNSFANSNTLFHSFLLNTNTGYLKL